MAHHKVGYWVLFHNINCRQRFDTLIREEAPSHDARYHLPCKVALCGFTLECRSGESYAPKLLQEKRQTRRSRSLYPHVTISYIPRNWRALRCRRPSSHNVSATTQLEPLRRLLGASVSTRSACRHHPSTAICSSDYAACGAKVNHCL